MLCAFAARLTLPLVYAAVPFYDATLCVAAKRVWAVTCSHPLLVAVVTGSTRLLGTLHLLQCAGAGIGVAIAMHAHALFQIVLCALAAVMAGSVVGTPLLCTMRVGLFAHVSAANRRPDDILAEIVPDEGLTDDGKKAAAEAQNANAATTASTPEDDDETRADGESPAKRGGRRV